MIDPRQVTTKFADLGFQVKALSESGILAPMRPDRTVRALMAGLILLTMLISHYLPRLTRAIPAPLVAIIVGTLLVQFTPVDSKTVAMVVTEQRALQREKEVKTADYNYRIIFLLNISCKS